MTSVSCSKDSEDTSAEENNTELVGDIILSTPEELADFHEKGYTKVIGDMTIRQMQDENSITSLENLTKLIEVTGHLMIRDTPGLINLSGLENLGSIGGFLTLIDNTNLTTLEGLNKLSIAGGLQITNSSGLVSLEGLSNLTSMGELSIEGSQNLHSLVGLDNIISMNAINLASTSLDDLNGLQNLEEFAIMILFDNHRLDDISALSNLKLITDEIAIFYNSNLSDFCPISNPLTSLTEDNIFIKDNAYNPTKSEIESGYCSLN